MLEIKCNSIPSRSKKKCIFFLHYCIFLKKKRFVFITSCTATVNKKGLITLFLVKTSSRKKYHISNKVPTAVELNQERKNGKLIKEFRFCELVHLIEANYKWFHDEEFDTLSIKIQTSFTSTCCGGSLEIRDHMARNSTETYIQLALIKALVWSWRRKWQCCEKWICFQFFIWEEKNHQTNKKFFLVSLYCSKCNWSYSNKIQKTCA